MSHEPFEYKPLDNVMRELGSPSIPESIEDIANELTDRGIDFVGIAASLKSKINQGIENHRHNQILYRQRRIAQTTSAGLTWTHPSVLLFAQGVDPVEKILAIASSWVLAVTDHQSSVITVDPFTIAKSRSITVRPRDTVVDARTVPLSGDRLEIEYNPYRSKARTRFSIAHEIAHTMFEDCGEMVRNRLSRDEMRGDEWQLEMLCNLAAAELLMPIATFPEIRSEQLSIEHLMTLRRRYEVGIEALLLRVVRLTDAPCAIFAASKREVTTEPANYQVDYVVCSRSWQSPVKAGDDLPKNNVASECTAIGFTAKSDERWAAITDQVLHTECVGIPPYPSHTYPRVVGFFVPTDPVESLVPKINEVVGNALTPRGNSPKILTFIINDKTTTWGAGFARKVGEKWPNAQKAFRDWLKEEDGSLRLGEVFTYSVAPDFWIAAMICQHGYGSSPASRIRYGPLKEGLDKVAALGNRVNAAVHMPRLGSGFSGGLWPIISQLIDESVCFKGIGVTVYDLPNANTKDSPSLPGLFDKGGV